MLIVSTHNAYRKKTIANCQTYSFKHLLQIFKINFSLLKLAITFRQ